LLPNAAVGGVRAVRDFSDSSLIVRLTRGRGWIALLCALLGGIVALNVISLSLTSGSGRTSLEIDALKTENSALRAEIAERLSASRVEMAASDLGLANPDPKEITYLSARDGDLERLARLLNTGTLMTQPSQPSSYPAPGTSYAPVSTSSGPPTTSTGSAPTTTAPSTPTPAPSTSSSSSSGGASSTGGTGTTGGVGL
jgi:cell division protein FtsL